MKVLIYFDKNSLAPVGGPAGYLYNLYNELKEKNIDNIYFLDDKKNLKKQKLKKFLIKNFTKATKYFNNRKQNYGLGIINKISKTKKFTTKMDLNQYDIIHFHDVLSLYMVKDSLKNYKGKVILTSHCPKAWHLEILDHIIKKEQLDEKRKILEEVEEFSFGRADYIILPVNYAEDCYYHTWSKYDKIHELNKNKYIYLPTGINEVKVSKSRDEIREKYNIPQNAFVISYIGRHNEVKGYDKLKEIGKKILAQNDDVYFIIGGVESPMKGLSHERWIEVGWTNKPNDLVNCSDLFILPNKETYFDLVLLEVLSIGKTVLLTKTGGNKLFEEYNKTGIFYYDYNNIDEAVKKIGYLKKKNLKEYDKLNYELFKKNFTIEIFVKKYIQILQKITDIKGETK